MKQWKTVLETVEITAEKLHSGFRLPVRYNQHVVAYLGVVRRGRWLVYKILVSYEILAKATYETGKKEPL